MVAYTTSDYTTGWLPGSIKLAALANSATADRSVNNNPLTQNGTITAAPVATGADLVAYSGFDGSNYLEQPYNDDLDFGTGDFCVMGWYYADDATTYGSLCSRGSASGETFFVYNNNGPLQVKVQGESVYTTSHTFTDNTWNHIVMVRDSGTLTTYVNGSSVGSVASSASVTDTDAVTRFGIRYNGTTPLGSGSLALWRISATAPTADQIAKIYEDERPLFQENAKATLTGSSDAVTALAHDPDTNLLHVGTSGGRSVFQGLRRVEEHTGTDSQSLAAISAVDGLVVEGK
jgi:hypothetical protein